MSAKQYVWLTSGAYDRLRTELATLAGQDPSRPDDGETAGTHDSDPEFISNVQRRRERIRQIQDLLDQAVVGEAPPDDGIAEPGMVLTVRFDDDDETETFLLGTREGAGLDGVQVYSPMSPLGVALSGARQGEHRSYCAPDGTTIHVTLLDAVPYGDHEHR